MSSRVSQPARKAQRGAAAPPLQRAEEQTPAPPRAFVTPQQFCRRWRMEGGVAVICYASHGVAAHAPPA